MSNNIPTLSTEIMYMQHTKQNPPVKLESKSSLYKEKKTNESADICNSVTRKINNAINFSFLININIEILTLLIDTELIDCL